MNGKIGAHSLVKLTMVNGDSKPRTYSYALCGDAAQKANLEKKRVFPEGTVIGHISGTTPSDERPGIIRSILGKSAGDEIDADLPCGKAHITIDAVMPFPLEACEALHI